MYQLKYSINVLYKIKYFHNLLIPLSTFPVVKEIEFYFVKVSAFSLEYIFYGTIYYHVSNIFLTPSLVTGK